jgi:hypothetical protein
MGRDALSHSPRVGASAGALPAMVRTDSTKMASMCRALQVQSSLRTCSAEKPTTDTAENIAPQGCMLEKTAC